MAVHAHDEVLDRIGWMLEIRLARWLCVAPEPVSVPSMAAIDAAG
jgi:hypothetical protein